MTRLELNLYGLLPTISSGGRGAALRRSLCSLIGSWLWIAGLATVAPPVPLATAQSPGGTQLEVEIFDPFRLSTRQAGFRPITIKVNALGGALSQKDLPIWIVQRHSNPYQQYIRDLVRYQRFVLPAGATGVTVQFVARNSGGSNSTEVLHLELDGDLQFRPNSKADFGVKQLYTPDEESWPKLNLLWVSPLPGLSLSTTERFAVDFDFTAGDQRQTVPLPKAQPPWVPPKLGKLLELHAVMSRLFGAEAIGRDRNQTQQQSFSGALELIEGADWLAACLPEQFPDNWQALVNVELVLLTRDEIATFSPAQLAALVDWVALGGRLVVTGCEPDSADWSQLPETLFAARLGPDQRLGPIQWQALLPDEAIRNFPQLPATIQSTGTNQFGNSSSFKQYYGGQLLSTISYRPQTLSGPPGGAEPPELSYFDHLIGRVICTPRQVPELDGAGWERLLAVAYGNGRGEQPASVLGRHNLGADRIENFEVQGVGEPPRLLFICLISLFALVVGPLACTVLYRTRRVNYLLAVVPALSLLATLGLVTYAILAEGFAFRTERFSFTRLDQNTQQAVTLTENAVFSGLSPQAYPVDAEELLLVKAGRTAGEERTEVSESGTRLVAPEIRARTDHQLFSASVRNTTQGLQVSRRLVEGSPVVTVRNQFDQPLRRALLRFEDGWYRVDELAAAAEAQAVPADAQVFLQEAQPFFDRAAALKNQPNLEFGSQPFPSFRTDPIQIWGLLGVLQATDYFESAAVAPGEYVVILDESTLPQRLKRQAQVQSQVHVIHGKW
ncbi:MAG: hypothetical protein ACK52A_09790 [Planctomycetota bacterium]